MHIQLLSLYYILLPHLSNLRSLLQPRFLPTKHAHGLYGFRGDCTFCSALCLINTKIFCTLQLSVLQPVKDARAGVVLSAVKSILNPSGLVCPEQMHLHPAGDMVHSTFCFAHEPKSLFMHPVCHRASFNQKNPENSRPNHTGQKPHSSLKAKSPNL